MNTKYASNYIYEYKLYNQTYKNKFHIEKKLKGRKSSESYLSYFPDGCMAWMLVSFMLFVGNILTLMNTYVIIVLFPKSITPKPVVSFLSLIGTLYFPVVLSNIVYLDSSLFTQAMLFVTHQPTSPTSCHVTHVNSYYQKGDNHPLPL